MFKKILIANRGDHQHRVLAAVKPERVVRAAHAGDLDAEVRHV